MSQTALQYSGEHILDRRILERQVGGHLLERSVLDLELAESIDIGDRGPGVLAPPLDQVRLAPAVTPQEIRDVHTRLCICENSSDLVLAELPLAHDHS